MKDKGLLKMAYEADVEVLKRAYEGDNAILKIVNASTAAIWTILIQKGIADKEESDMYRKIALDCLKEITEED